MHRRLVAVHRPVQHVDVFAVALLELLLERLEDVQQLLWRRAAALFAKLEDGFFRAGALVVANLLYGAVALRVAALGIARTLPGDIIGIMPLVKDSLYLLKGRNVGAPFACAHPVQPVPIDIFVRFRRVNVFGVGHVKIAVIVLGREHAVLSGTTVVPGCSDFTRMYLLVCGRRERSDRFPLFAAETTRYKVTHSITFIGRRAALWVKGFASEH